jgi:transmembrane sensor
LSFDLGRDPPDDRQPAAEQSAAEQSAEEQSLRAEAVGWLIRLQEAPGDACLRAAVDAWLAESERHRRAYADMEPLWRQAEEVGALRAARARHPSPHAGPRPSRHPSRRWIAAAGLALAASLAVSVAFVSLPTVRLWLAADHRTGVAELRDVLLEDGSRVILDARSAIAVDYAAGRRSVTLLAGQAFFEVTPAPARPFVVAAGTVAVRVTGTAFDVARSDSGVAVAVRSGSVTVSEQGRGDVADLTGGQQVRLAPDRAAVRGAVSPDDVGSWRRRRLVVYDRPVRDVVQQIARYTDAVIVFADGRIADQLVTATVDLRRPRDALRAVVDLKHGTVTEISPYLMVISSR